MGFIQCRSTLLPTDHWRSTLTGENIQEIIEGTLKGEIDFECDQFKNVSLKTKLLVKGFLNHDPESRLDAKSALAHSYFNKQKNITIIKKESYLSKNNSSFAELLQPNSTSDLEIISEPQEIIIINKKPELSISTGSPSSNKIPSKSKIRGSNIRNSSAIHLPRILSSVKLSKQCIEETKDSQKSPTARNAKKFLSPEIHRQKVQNWANAFDSPAFFGGSPIVARKVKKIEYSRVFALKVSSSKSPTRS